MVAWGLFILLLALACAEIPAGVNYLHGGPWEEVQCTPDGWFQSQCTTVIHSFNVCDHHVDATIDNYYTLIDTASNLSLERFRGSEPGKLVLGANRQMDCSIPRCVGSRDDLWSCGGMALTVNEWATFTDLMFVEPGKGPRGPICGTPSINMWVQKTKHRYSDGYFWEVKPHRANIPTADDARAMMRAARTIEECDVFDGKHSPNEEYAQILKTCLRME